MFVAGSQDFYHIKGDRVKSLLYTLELALQSKITAFQFRQKGDLDLQDNTEIKKLAIECQRLCEKYGVPFIINDDVHLALELKACGVHIGQEDMALEKAITLCKNRLFIGLSVNTLEQALKVYKMDGVAYLGIGSIFPTQSKKDVKQVVGADFLKQLQAFKIQKPLVAIGGITTDNVSELRMCGASGVAVISAITQARDISTAIREILLNF